MAHLTPPSYGSTTLGDRGASARRVVPSVAFPLEPGQTATWGIVLPPNSSGSDVTVGRIEPVDVRGLKILGIVASRPDVDGSIVNALGFPPEGIATGSVVGAIIPGGSPPSELQVLVGIRLIDGSTRGSIDGLRLEYMTAGRSNEIDLPYGLEFEPAPGSSNTAAP